MRYGRIFSSRGLLSLAMLCRIESGEKLLLDEEPQINHIDISSQVSGGVRRSTGRASSRACVMIET